MLDDYKSGSTDKAVNIIPYYNYYMYSPIRTNSNITADDIKNFLASRGYIYDSEGVILATNLPTFSLAFMPYQIKDKHAVANKIAPLIGIETSDLYNKINQKISIVRLNGRGRNISDEVAKKINLLN